MSKVFSPSQTVSAMRCPMLNELKKEGWRLRDQNVALLAQITGKAIAAGLSTYNSWRKATEQGGRSIDLTSASEREAISKACMELGLGMCAREMEQVERIGYVLNPATETYLKQMQDRICGSLVKYVTADPIPATWRIVDTECNLGPESGNARPDLVVRENTGALAVIDYKTQSTYKAAYAAQNTEAYRESHQMKHYLYFGASFYKEPIERYHISQITTLPYRHDLHTFEVNAESLALWYQSTGAMWEYIEAVELGKTRPWMAAEHRTKFGECEMYAACFRYRFDPQLMKAKYIQVEKEPE